MKRVNKHKELQRYQQQLKALQKADDYTHEQKAMLEDIYNRKIKSLRKIVLEINNKNEK